MPLAPRTPDEAKKISELNVSSLAGFEPPAQPLLSLIRYTAMPILVRKPSRKTLTASGLHQSNTKLKAENRPKRFLDIVIATSLFTLLSPVLLILAALVRLSGPGPVVYRQVRVGANGAKFTLLKFRTMHESEQFLQATVNDRRVTRIGRLLRRTSLDELLQLINVIRGEMSLVGPRPHAAETCVEGILFEDAVKSYRQRHQVRPGITGLAQIRGQRGETRTIRSFEQRMSSDVEYIENWSMWLDLTILVKTVPLLFGQDNAY
jgi:lipopolysaccharide/colanic/teichoic acid biosynthesis glycosyltransferase